MTGNPLDLLFIIIVAFFAVVAAFHGFVKEVFSKIAFVGALILAVVFTNTLKIAFVDSVKSDMLAAVISFLIIFVGSFLIIKIIQEIFSKIFSASILKSLDHALGFLFGVVEGVAVVSAIILVFTMQPWFDTSSILAGSIFYNFLMPFISDATKTIGEIAA